MAGIQPDTRDPYRARTAIPGESFPLAAPGRRPFNDAGVGLAWFGGGLILALLTFNLARFGGGGGSRYLACLAPVLYGIYRMLRSPSRKI